MEILKSNLKNVKWFSIILINSFLLSSCWMKQMPACSKYQIVNQTNGVLKVENPEYNRLMSGTFLVANYILVPTAVGLIAKNNGENFWAGFGLSFPLTGISGALVAKNLRNNSSKPYDNELNWGKKMAFLGIGKLRGNFTLVEEGYIGRDRIIYYVKNDAYKTYQFIHPIDVTFFKRAFPSIDPSVQLNAIYDNMIRYPTNYYYDDLITPINSIYPKHETTNKINVLHNQFVNARKTGVVLGVAVVATMANKIFGGSTSNTQIENCNSSLEVDPECDGFDCFFFICNEKGNGRIIRIEQMAEHKFKVGAGDQIEYASTSSEAETIAKKLTQCNCN